VAHGTESLAADTANNPLDNKFLVVALACRRALQLRNGARPHLDPQGHNTCVMAVAEVVSGAVAYSVV
jgi:DNA-directed RNA polymerase subunit K/omega